MSGFLFEDTQQYCKAFSFGFSNEPLNLVTNLGFIIAAYLAHTYIKKKYTEPAPLYFKVLIYNIYIIGIASAVHHIFSIGLTMIADVVPIAIFVVLFIYFALKNLLQLTLAQQIGGFALLFSLSFVSIFFLDYAPLQTSNNYFGAITMIFVVSLAASYKSHSKAAKKMFVGGCFVCLAVFFRTIDQSVCSSFPIGTHFLWHTLNAIAFYFFMTALAEGPTVRKAAQTS